MGSCSKILPTGAKKDEKSVEASGLKDRNKRPEGLSSGYDGLC